MEINVSIVDQRKPVYGSCLWLEGKDVKVLINDESGIHAVFDGIDCVYVGKIKDGEVEFFEKFKILEFADVLGQFIQGQVYRLDLARRRAHDDACYGSLSFKLIE